MIHLNDGHHDIERGYDDLVNEILSDPVVSASDEFVNGVVIERLGMVFGE